MTIQEITRLLREYRSFAAMADPTRFTSRTEVDLAYRGVFGMNPALMRLTPEEKAQGFLDQEKRARLIRDLMAGERVEASELERLLGVNYAQLEAAEAEANPIKKPIPDRLVVLSFDDAIKDQVTLAAPLLKKLGFGATFFITEMEQDDDPVFGKPPFSDKSHYMTWEEIASLQEMGFELANHSLHHVRRAHERGLDFQLAEIEGMEREFAAHGLRAPVTYAYPSGICNDVTFAAAEQKGYLWARGNMESGFLGMSCMTYYDPLQDSPLALRSFGDCDFYSDELLNIRIDGARDGKILGLTYHSIAAAGNFPGGASFERQMELLARQDCTVISTEQLGEYIDPIKAREYTRR